MRRSYHDEMGPYSEPAVKPDLNTYPVDVEEGDNPTYEEPPDESILIYTDDGNVLGVSQTFINEYKHLTEHPGAMSSLKTYIANKFK